MYNGQGAPLVPIGDLDLFPNYKFCLNLGGFSNISVKELDGIKAFDISPLNIVLNHYSKKIGHDFDNLGLLSSSGEVLNNLLVKLNSLNYYQIDGPKSLGLEWVKEHIFPLIDSYDLEVDQILRTVVEHCAFQITNLLRANNLTNGLYTGGGVYNSFLIQRISSLSLQDITTADPIIIEFKEALIFGFLGVLRLKELPNCLHSVTGASHRIIVAAGFIYLNI